MMPPRGYERVKALRAKRYVRARMLLIRKEAEKYQNRIAKMSALYSQPLVTGNSNSLEEALKQPTLQNEYPKDSFWDKNLWKIRTVRKWTGFRFVIQDYNGHDGCCVESWTLHLGFFWIIRYRHAY